MAESAFSFDVDGLKVSITFGVVKATKKFKKQAEVDAAKLLFDNTLKAVKAKKGAASLKAELFTLFGVDFNTVPKTGDKGAATTDVAPKEAKLKKGEAKPSSPEKKEKSTAAAKPDKTTAKKSTGSASGSKVAAPKKEEAPKANKTTFVQVGKNVTVVIDGAKYTKKFDSDATIADIKKSYDKIEKYEALDKMSTAQALALGKLKSGIIDLMQANTNKGKKEKEAAETQVKAIDKQMNKMKKEAVEVKTPNKDVAKILKEGGVELDDEQLAGVEKAIAKKKDVAPVAAPAPVKRRGEY